jgi:hypothetical protein
MLDACPDSMIGVRDRTLLALGFAGAFRTGDRLQQPGRRRDPGRRRRSCRNRQLGDLPHIALWVILGVWWIAAASAIGRANR